MAKRHSSLWACTLLVFYSRLAPATATCEGREGYFRDTKTRFCKGCNECFPGVRIVAACTDYSDTVCHPQNECANAQYVYDERYDYYCRPVLKKDCMDPKLSLSQPTNCSTLGANCGCRRVPSDHRKVECYCEPIATSRPYESETPHVTTLQTSTSSEASTSLSVFNVLSVTPTATPTDAESKSLDTAELSGGIKDSIDAATLAVILITTAMCIGIGIGIGIVLCRYRKRCNQNIRGFCDVETCVAHSHLQKPIEHSNNDNRSIHNGEQDNRLAREPSRLGTTIEVERMVEAAGSGIAIPRRASTDSRLVMARNVFNCYHDKEHLIALMDQLICNKVSWKQIAGHLGYSPQEIRSMEGVCLYSQTQTGAGYMYEKWQSREDATIENLFKAAKAEARGDIVDHIRKVCREQGYTTAAILEETDYDSMHTVRHDLAVPPPPPPLSPPNMETFV